MNKIVSTIIIVSLGVLVSCQLMSSTDSNTITLTATNHVLLAGPVTDQSVAKAQVQLSEISANLEKDDVIYLVLDTPGGSVTAGNLFIDFANSLPQKIKPICIFCASMGYHIFQSLDERLVYESSTLMSHRVSISGLSGQIPGEAVTRLDDIKVTSQFMDEKVAKRLGVSVQDYQKLIYDELWLSGVNAVKMKHADRIAKISCDSYLSLETRSETVDTLFGPVDVTYSMCPLISGFLGFKFQKASMWANLPESFGMKSKQEVIREIKRVKRTIVRGN